MLQNNNKVYYYQINQGNNSKLIKQAIQKRTNWQESLNNIPNFIWNMNDKQFKYLNNNQILNHIPNHRELTLKCNLIKNLKQYCKNNHFYIWDITPLSIIIDFIGNSQSINQSIKEFQDIYELFHPKNNKELQQSFKYKDQFTRPKLHNCMLSDNHYLWILKPNQYNCGRGIIIFQTIEELKELLLSFNKGDINSINGNNKIKSTQFVIQKYIQQPLLLDGRKFDIRIWVLVTHQFDIYIFKEGYARLSSEMFDLDNLEPFVHLTNNAIQKYSQKYGLFEIGNQISYSKLDYYTNGEFTRTVLPKIKSIIVFTWMSVQTTFQKCKYAFEIFGYDFMIDHQLRPWLIEINTNPCLEESSPLLQELLPKMIDDAFKIVIDSILTKKEEPTDWEHLLKL